MADLIVAPTSGKSLTPTMPKEVPAELKAMEFKMDETLLGDSPETIKIGKEEVKLVEPDIKKEEVKVEETKKEEVKKEEVKKVAAPQKAFKIGEKTNLPKEKKEVNEFTGVTSMEVDLHIEELIDDIRGMSNGEIIQIQLKHFQKKLDEAIAKKMRSIVFIHGIGK